MQIGLLRIHFARLEARREGNPIHLTAKEFALLRLLLETPGEPVSRERFLDMIWGVNAFPTTRTVDNHIAMLRSKLEPDPDAPRHLRTVHGVGYKLVLEGSENRPDPVQPR
jgi:DNA-binding response OmpR family regulator